MLAGCMLSLAALESFFFIVDLPCNVLAMIMSLSRWSAAESTVCKCRAYVKSPIYNVKTAALVKRGEGRARAGYKTARGVFFCLYALKIFSFHE